MADIHAATGLLRNTDTLIERYLPDAARLVVSDSQTLTACGWERLPFAYQAHHCFPSSPKATKAQADALAAEAQDATGIIAIGSGTMNDLCKYAAHHTGVPYVVIATAPSMNGYVSPNASLAEHGHKQSFAASAPQAVLADLDILRAAPPRLIASGIGDTLCRSTIVTDVQLSHHYCGTDAYEASFRAMTECEFPLLETLGTPDSCEPLFRALITSGQAMADAGNSAPASQGEHMLAHLLEMLDLDLANRHYHGEVIAVTTLMMAKLQEKYQGQAPIKTTFPLQRMQQLFGHALAEQWQAAYAAKWHNVALELPPPAFPTTRLDAQTLEMILRKSGCSTHHSELGIDDDVMQQAMALAVFSRDRFTALDIAVKDYISGI